MKEGIDFCDFIEAQERLITFSANEATENVKSDIETLIAYSAHKRMEAETYEKLIRAIFGKAGIAKLDSLEERVEKLETMARRGKL